jgi:heme A synthase
MLTAMLVLTCELAAAVSMYVEDLARRDRFAALDGQRVRPLGTMALMALGWMSAVVWVGGYMAESGASTACAAWPTCNGFAVLPGADGQEIIHMAHRYLAGSFAFFVAPFVVMAWRRRGELPWAAELAVAVGALFSAQVVVGALNVWFAFPDAVTVSHTALASGVWFVLSAAMLLAYYTPVAAPVAGAAGVAEATA